MENKIRSPGRGGPDVEEERGGQIVGVASRLGEVVARQALVRPGERGIMG